MEAAASGSDSATTLEERAPWSRVQFGDGTDGNQEHMVSEGPKALSPKLAQALFASMFVVL